MPLIGRLVAACAASLLAGATAGAETALPQPGPQRPTAANARNSWEMCNNSDESKVWVAYSYVENKTWITKGWRTIEKGKCAILVAPVENRYVYYYAEGLRQRWTGEKRSCVDPKQSFVFKGDDCPKGGKMYPFKEVDVGDAVSLTTNLDQ